MGPARALAQGLPGIAWVRSAVPIGAVMIDDSISRALCLMQQALELLDQAAAPPDVGAHLDLAIQRLRDAMDTQGKAQL